MGEAWRGSVVRGQEGVARLVREWKRIAVLGIKTEAQRDQPAFYVAEYMARAGYDIVPVPVYFPEATRILDRPVYRTVREVPGAVDMVDVFRRPRDIPPHVDDILAAHPRVVWLQLGIRHEQAAEAFPRPATQVLQDRCLLVEHRRLRG